MSSHPFDNEFRVTGEHKEKFRRDGFVKLEGFFNAAVVNMLFDRIEVEMGRAAPSSTASDFLFSRLRYDLEGERADIYELLERPYFRRALTDLAERDLFLTFEVFFEIEKERHRGFGWHVDLPSFSYQVAAEHACSLWVPLHPVDTKGQRGGMAYVPVNVVSGDFTYQIERAIVSTLEAKERAGVRTSIGDYLGMQAGILNSPAMAEIFENHQVEDDFEPGDVLLFNKLVAHRSIMLGEGPLPKRAAYTMRFVDAGSHYDLQGAQTLEFPVEKYGKGPIPYKPHARGHIKIAEAGGRDGDVLAECAFFDNRDRRMIRREVR